MNLKSLKINTKISLPKEDDRWVPDGDNFWFLPWLFDFQNDAYGGYWYSKTNSIEPLHYHSGIVQGTLLKGEIILNCEEEKTLFHENDSFILPPNIFHSAELIAKDNEFLMFACVHGKTYYNEGKEILDANSYFELVKKQYEEFNLPFPFLYKKKEI